MNDEQTALPMVPTVDYVRYGEVDDQLVTQMGDAIARGDERAQAELRLETAHRDMVRRDATLSELVTAVQGRDEFIDVPALARHHAFWACAMEREVERAAGHVSAARTLGPQQEAER